MGEWVSIAESPLAQGRVTVKTIEPGREEDEAQVFCHSFLICL